MASWNSVQKYESEMACAEVSQRNLYSVYFVPVQVSHQSQQSTSVNICIAILSCDLLKYLQ